MLRYALFLLPALALAQTPQNSVTVTASRNTSAAPDQAVISVSVTTPTSGTIDDAVAALQGSGITAANLSGISIVQSASGRQTLTQLQWSFSLPIDLTALKSTIATLTGLQQAAASKSTSTAISFSVQGTQVSQKAAQSQPCSLPDLMSDARSQAAKLATAANLSVGQVLAVSGGTASTAAGAGGNAFSAAVSQPVCSLTVKFALTGAI